MTTTFNSPASSADPAPKADEPQVVLEYNGKKYTQAELITKLTHGDQFIETLKSERDEDRKLLADAAEQLKKATNSEELLKKLKEEKQPAPASTPATTTAVDIEGTVAKVIADREVALSRAKNFESVKSELQKAFGEKADSKVKEVCAEVGMTFEQAIELAHTAPEAFKRFFPDLTKQAPKSGVPAGNVNTAALNGKPDKPKSGYWDAKSGKEQVAAYLQRLKELSGE